MTVRLIVLTAIVASAIACGSSDNPASPSPVTSGGTTVSIPSGAGNLTTNAYAPNPLTISRGTSVTWTNNDIEAHTATSNNGTFSSGIIQPRSSFTFTFDTAGSYAYHCTIHPGMVGTVVVQ